MLVKIPVRKQNRWVQPGSRIDTMRIQHHHTPKGIHYVTAGSGSPLLLIPGIGATWRMYLPQLVSLSQSHLVISLDLRGNGDSPTLAGPISSVLSTQALDVVEVLDDLQLRRANVAGISYGGIIVQRLLIDHADRVASAIICDSFADTTPRNLVEKINLLGADQVGVFAWSGKTRRRVLGPAIAWQYRRWPLARKAMLEVVASERGAELALQRQAINRINFVPELSQVAVPCLCLVGGSSRMLVSRMRQVSQAIPGAVLRVIPDSFDPSNLCNRKVFEALVQQFLAHLES